MEGNIGFIPSPDPPKLPGSICFTLPKRRIWRISLARNVLWHMVELSHTTARCLRALVMATLILLLSPRNPTAPNVFDRTYFVMIFKKKIQKGENMSDYVNFWRLVLNKRNTSNKLFSIQRKPNIGVSKFKTPLMNHIFHMFGF